MYRIGDYVFTTDGFDMPKPRLRVVDHFVSHVGGFDMPANHHTDDSRADISGYACRTIESDLSLFFRSDQLRPATKMEIVSYKPIDA